jgi:hypothetical protein
MEYCKAIEKMEGNSSKNARLSLLHIPCHTLTISALPLLGVEKLVNRQVLTISISRMSALVPSGLANQGQQLDSRTLRGIALELRAQVVVLRLKDHHGNSDGVVETRLGGRMSKILRNIHESMMN